LGAAGAQAAGGGPEPVGNRRCVYLIQFSDMDIPGRRRPREFSRAEFAALVLQDHAVYFASRGRNNPLTKWAVFQESHESGQPHLIMSAAGRGGLGCGGKEGDVREPHTVAVRCFKTNSRFSNFLQRRSCSYMKHGFLTSWTHAHDALLLCLTRFQESSFPIKHLRFSVEHA